jgi:protein-arginine kinase activator protein McsA
LEKRLDDAIAKEDYEKAAQLRDELRKLQGRTS